MHATTETILAVGYARRSTDMQERSIPDQKAFVERWAKEHGYRILRWYVDDAISGTSTRGRDAFEQMIRDAEGGKGGFDAVLCYDISRFSRGGTNETGYYLHRLKMVGVEGVFCAEGIPQGDEGELLQGVKSWQARQYSVKLSRDSIRGQHSTVTIRHSAMGGRAPYGYDRQYQMADGKPLRTIRTLCDGRRQEFDAEGRHMRFIDADVPLGKKLKSDIVRLVPGDPEHIKVVRLIFDMCAKGFGFRSIVIELSRRGIAGPMRSEWNRMAIKTILQNPVYRGALVWNRRTFGKIHAVAADGTPCPKKAGGSTRNSKDRWIVIESVHEPLVSDAVFEKAQREMDRRRDKGGLARPTKRYLLSGLIKCMHCGFNFHGAILKNDAGEIRYYTDGGYRARGISVCRSTHIQAAALDEFVMQRVSAIIPADEKAMAAATQRFITALSAKAAAQDNGTAIEKELAAVNRRIKALVTTLADGDLNDLPEVKQALTEMKRRRETLNARQANTASPAARFTDEQAREWATATLHDLAGALRGKPTSETLRRVIHNCVDRIEIDPEAKRGRLFLPTDTWSLLQLSASRRGTSASSSHS
ncbi:MAG: recombinase family protein [Phycisphaeraceae bacterium]|nr:recombinase family protein [Phycisphaeraceae bacterium]